MMNTTYFSDTTRIKAHNISDKMPSTLSWVGCTPWLPTNASRKAYSGLVPISPNTTPIAPSISAGSACFWKAWANGAG